MSRADIIAQFRSRIAAGKRNKLSKAELEVLIESLIERLQRATSASDIHQLCRDEIALLEEGYPRLTLASIYIPRYRAAIKGAIASGQLPLTAETSHAYEYQQRVTGKREYRQEHWALTYLKYTPQEYEQLDQRQAQVNRRRLMSLQRVPLVRYLEVIDSLLHSTDKFAARHQAIAIAGLTGRRMGEVVARGEFQLTGHPYLLHFTGQQKYERDGYDIVTLIPADYLLDQINRFRSAPEIQEFSDLSDQDLRQYLNKFDVQVNKECHRYLAEVVPPLEGKKTVTIHNLRSLWGAIATHFFCPEDQHEYAFLQHYLGHVLKSSATGHYFRYQLTDVEGHLLKDKGVMLSTVPELPLLDREDGVMDEQSSLFESSVAEPQGVYPGTTLQTQLIQLQQDWQLRWDELVQRVVALEVTVSPDQASAQLDQIKQLQQEKTALQQENAALAQQLEEAQSKLEQFRQLLLGESEPQRPSVPRPSPVPRVAEGASEIVSSPKVQSVAQPLVAIAKPSKRQPRKGRKPGQAVERAKRIFVQVQEWNRQNPESTFVINPGFLETVFRINRKAAKQFCDEFQAELWEHHQEIGVENEISHNRGKDVEALLEFVDQS